MTKLACGLILIPLAVSIASAIGCSYGVAAPACGPGATALCPDEGVTTNDGSDVHPVSAATPTAAYNNTEGIIPDGTYRLTAIHVLNKVVTAQEAAQTQRITVQINGFQNTAGDHGSFVGLVRSNGDPDQAVHGQIMHVSAPTENAPGPFHVESDTITRLLNDGQFGCAATSTSFALASADGPEVNLLDPDAGADAGGGNFAQPTTEYIFTRE